MLSLLGGLALAALPDIDQPLKTGARAERDAAVVIGIEDYFVLPDVPHAARDADAFYRFLVYTRGVPSSRVRLLDKGASREAILAAAEEVGALGSEGGTVWVYFAGHGAASPQTGERLLLGDDIRPDLAAFEARAVPVEALRASLAKGGARVMMVLDTCYTGAGRAGEELIAGKRFAVPSYATATAAQVAEWTAAGPGEWSGPLEPARHGAFTYLAIGAMRGWADGELDGRPDGQVTAEEAQLYVQSALAALQLREQTPVLATEAPAGWVLTSGATEAAPVLDASMSSSPRSTAPPAVVGDDEWSAPVRIAPPPPPKPLPDEPGWLAARVEALNGRAAERAPGITQGLLVHQVHALGSASRDLKSGQVITHADGRPVATEADLEEVLARHGPGEQVELQIAGLGLDMPWPVKLDPQPDRLTGPTGSCLMVRPEAGWVCDDWTRNITVSTAPDGFDLQEFAASELERLKGDPALKGIRYRLEPVASVAGGVGLIAVRYQHRDARGFYVTGHHAGSATRYSCHVPGDVVAPCTQDIARVHSGLSER